jgi:predicted phosphodiesterase
MGRCLLLADVHANLQALEAVLDDAGRTGGFDSVWMLGDVVGYGPQPDECVERLRQESLVAVAGNHDLGAVGRADLARFNADAAEACAWSGTRLSESSRRYLMQLPLSRQVSPFLLVHGSPRDPVWEYVTSSSQAAALAPFCNEAHCIVGHTHCQSAFAMHEPVESAGDSAARVSRLALRGRLIINPGAVGQPRDGDPRAAYAILDCDADAVSFHRVKYDVRATTDLMLRIGLPAALAGRLHAGY